MTLTDNIQLASTTSGSTSASRSNGFSSRDNSSGGVSLNGHNGPSTGTGTIYGGSNSKAGSSLATATSPSVAPSINTQMSSRAGTSPSVASPAAATPGRRSGGFNPSGYGNPGRRSPTGSVASALTANSGSKFAKVRSTPTALDMDVVREQHKHMKRAAAKKANDVQVSDSDSN